MLLAHVGSTSHLHQSPCKSKVSFQEKTETITERGKSPRHPRRSTKSMGETQSTETPEKQSEDPKGAPLPLRLSEAAAAGAGQAPSLADLPPGAAHAASAVALVCAPADAEGMAAAAESASGVAKGLSNLMPGIFAFPVAVMSPVALLLKSVMKDSPPAEASKEEQAKEAAAKEHSEATEHAHAKRAEESSKALDKHSKEATAERAKKIPEESLKPSSGTRRETPKETKKEAIKILEEAMIVETLRDSATSAHIRPEIHRASGDCAYDVPPSEGSRAERTRQIVGQFSVAEMRNIENFVRGKQREELSGDEDEVLSIDGETSGKTTPSYLCRGWDEDPVLTSEQATASSGKVSDKRDASAVQTKTDLLDEPSDRMRPGGSPPMAISSQSSHINDSSSLQSSDMSWDTPSPGDSPPSEIPWSPPQSAALLASSTRKSLEGLTHLQASDQKSPPTRLPLCGAITSPPNVSPSVTSCTESTESPSPPQRSSLSPSPVHSPAESITAFRLALDSKLSPPSDDAHSPNALADQPSPHSFACSGLMSPTQECLPNSSSPQSPLRHTTLSQQALISSVSSSQESTTLMESPQMSSTSTSVWKFPQQSGETTPFGNESKHTIRSVVEARSDAQSSITMSPTLSLTSTSSPIQLSSTFETAPQGNTLSSPQSLSMLETSKVSTLTESQSLQRSSSSSSAWQTYGTSTLTSSLELSSTQSTEPESDGQTAMLFTGPFPQSLQFSPLSSPTQLSPIEEAQPERSPSPSPTASASSSRDSPCLQSQSLQTSSVWQSSTLSGNTSPFDPSSKQSIETLLSTSPDWPSSSKQQSCSSAPETELLQQQFLQSPPFLTSVSSMTSSLTDSTLKLSPSSAVESLPLSRVISPEEPKLVSSPMLQSPTGVDTTLGEHLIKVGTRSPFETIHRSGVTSPSGEDSDQSPPTSRPLSGSYNCLSYSTLSTSCSPSPSQSYSSSLQEPPSSKLTLHHSTQGGSTMDALHEAMPTPLLEQQQISLDAASKQLTPPESISLAGSSVSSRAGSAPPRPVPDAPTPPTSSLEGGSSSGSYLLATLPATLKALDPATPLAPRPRRDLAADHRLSIVEEEATVPSVDSGGATGTISSVSSDSIPCNRASSSEYDPIDMSYSGVSGVCGCSRSESSRWSNETNTSEGEEEEVWELPAEKRWVRSAPPTSRPSQAPAPTPPLRSPFATTPHTPGVATASESEGVGASASRRGSSESWASVASMASVTSPSWNSESGIVTNSEAFRKFLDLFEPSPSRSEQDTPSGSVTASSGSGDEEEDEQSALSAPVPATAAIAT